VPKAGDAFDPIAADRVLSWPNGYANNDPVDYSDLRQWRGRPVHILGGNPHELIAEIGIHLGAARAIDLSDYHPDDGRIYLIHRPEGPDKIGTPLKNGHDGERYVNLSPRLREFIDDYVRANRDDVTDRYGLEPLLTTSNGRPSTATIRHDFYKATRPCVYANECPDEREPSTREAVKNEYASECSSSYSPHPPRKCSILRPLDEDVSKDLLSDRVRCLYPHSRKTLRPAERGAEIRATTREISGSSRRVLVTGYGIRSIRLSDTSRLSLGNNVSDHIVGPGERYSPGDE